MPQSPIHITGIFSTATSVYVGGLDRSFQVTSYSTDGAGGGTLWVAGSERPGNQSGVVLQQVSINAGPSDDVISEIKRGFFNYINCFTTGVSSANTGGVNVVIRFDGPQWASS